MYISQTLKARNTLTSLLLYTFRGRVMRNLNSRTISNLTSRETETRFYYKMSQMRSSFILQCNTISVNITIGTTTKRVIDFSFLLARRGGSKIITHILMSGYDDFRSSSLRDFGAAKQNDARTDYRVLERSQ